MLKDADANLRVSGRLSPERWKRLEEIYNVTLPMSQDERCAILAQVCGEDKELREEAETLLAADDGAGSFLNSGAYTLGLEVLAGAERGGSEKGLLSVGEILDGRYEILEEIIGGGMGNVYKARDGRLGWMVAVKVLKEDASKNSWMVDKFLDEKEALAKIDHPNVVRLVDTGELSNGAPYLVMKYIEGSDLEQILAAAKDGLDPVRVAAIMLQAGQGVAALHKAGMVHRDLKPSNFVVGDNDHEFFLKVIDLGIVRVLGTNTRLDQIPGTPPYLSPEQLSGQDVTSASDVYALAVTAYELLKGQPLFDSKGMPPNEFVLRLIRWQQEVAEMTPQALLPAWPEAARVILQALSLDPDQRPQAQVFGNELAAALILPDVVTVIEGRDGLLRRLVSWLTSHKRRLIATAVILVAVGMMWWAISAPLKPGNSIITPQPGPAPDLRSESALTYWLTIVRQRDGKTILATGRETFDTGDEFRFNIVPSQPGALYIFNEGTSGNWHTLFPTRENNRGNSQLATSENIETRGSGFTNRSGKERGTERVWVVWAAQPVQVLEDIVRQSLGASLTISDPSQKATLRQFMAEHGATPDIYMDKDRSQVTIKGRGEVLAYLLELEHKDWK